MKADIIQTALENLQNNTGVILHWKESGPLDGLLNIQTENRELQFVVEVKKELRQHQLNKLIQFQNQFGNLLVIAENIFPKIKEQLISYKIGYLETNGNVYLKKGGIYFYIEKSKDITRKKFKGNRAFTKTGLKVVFHLLMDKTLINNTQREIAQITEVGLGNIPQVINGLKETGYLISLNKKELLWENRKELLDRWIQEYGIELKPKLKKGNYTIQNNWEEINLDKNHTVWGGEPAADILTNYLRPEKLTLYTKEKQLNLIKNYRLIPKKEGEIEVYEMFWNSLNSQKTAPPLLVYADLQLEGGKRNLETAEIIFNEHIKPNL